MKKKTFVTLSVMSLILSLSTATFAATTRSTTYNRNINGYSGRGMNYNARMIDDNGKFLSLEDYTKKLDDAIAAGTITTDDKEFYLDRYNNGCNGNATNRGGCGGCYR